MGRLIYFHAADIMGENLRRCEMLCSRLRQEKNVVFFLADGRAGTTDFKYSI